MIDMRWPRRRLGAVPGDHIAADLANDVRRLVADDESACDLDALCELGDFSYRPARLDTASGGVEALLFARDGGGFQILVDPGPIANATLRRHRIRFRVAHELGHSFFYDRRPSIARRLLKSSAAEETFCDAFATALLVPSTVIQQRAPTPQCIAELSEKLDVSVQLAGNAVAKAHEGSFVLGLRLKDDHVSVWWSAGKSPFSRRAELGNRWIDLVRTECNQELDLGEAWGTFDARFGKIHKTYGVAVLLPHSQAERVVPPRA